jgi:hypothetical protein
MGLSFLAPMLLGGAALVAVPVVLHLLMRRKPVPHEFPALRFLRERAVSNRRRLRLSHLLLLLLRMAALVLLALALSRPVLRGAAWLADGEAPVAAAFVFDTAPRMLLREANRTRLEQAVVMARVLFGKLPAGSSVAVLDTGGGPAAFAPTVAAAEARIDRLAAATPTVGLAAAIAAGRRLLESSDKPRRELYVFTDCSRSAWGRAPAAAEERDDATSMLVVDVGAAKPRNFGIESLDVPADRVAAGTPVVLSAALARAGPDASRPVAVELRMPDGRYARRAVKPVAWTAAASAQADFELAGLQPGTWQGRLLVDGADDLEADDVRFFTVDVGPPTAVIVAAPAPAARTGVFVAEALAPTALRRAGTARFAPKLVDVATIDAVPWTEARGIVLVDPPPLPPRTWEALREWVATGRGLVVWLGPRAADAGFDSDAARRVLGGRPVRVWRSPDDGNYLAPGKLDHPILSAFRRVGDAVPWQDFPVRRHWEFEPLADPAGDTGPGTTVVAPYRNGLPAVLEHRVGQGTVVVLTTPASQAAGDPDAWNTLATGFEPWPFVMLANETLLHALDTAAERNIAAGAAAVLHLDRRDLATAFVRTPGGDDFPVAVDQERGTVTVTATQQPGNYTLRAGGGDEGVTSGFSANLDADAIDFTRLADGDLAAALGPDTPVARTEAELVRDVKLERVGSELFGWVILLAAAAMAGDWIVANRFYAPREDAGAGSAAAAFAGAAAGGPDRGVGPPAPEPVPPPVPAAAPAQPPGPPPRRPGPPPVPPPLPEVPA